MKRLFILSFLVLASASTCPAQQHPAPHPQAPKYYGAVDLGSRGIKAFLFSFVREGDGPDAQAVYKNEINTKLVSGAQGDKFTPAGIEEAATAVSTLLGELKSQAADRKLANVEYYVVGSSGVAKFANHDDLKAAVDKAAGISMSFVDAAHEAYYGLLSGIPKYRRNVSVMVDIGSGNTKIAYLDHGESRATEIPYGSVTLRKAALTADPDYTVGLNKLLVDKIAPAYKEQPKVASCSTPISRHRFYWIGGAAWATATFTHPETAKYGYVSISLSDINSFLSQLQDKSWLDREPQFHFAPDVKPSTRQIIQAANLADRKAVAEVFSREDLLAGVSIMKTILQGQDVSPTVFFVRNGNYLFGYALEKYREDNDEQADEVIQRGDPSAPSYFAGIDLGSRGIKAYIFSFVQEGEGPDARSVFKDIINTKLTSSADGKKFTAKGIQEAADATSELVCEMKSYAAEKNIDPRYYIVGSSGVAEFENHDDLKTAVDQKTGLSLDFISVQDEGRYGLKSAVPTPRLQEALHADIGSSNTKLGCMVRDIYNPSEIPFGSVTLRKAVPPGGDYLVNLQNTLKPVSEAYNNERMNTPCLGSRSRIYLIGGASWATATFSRPEAALWGYVPLARKDVDLFYKHLSDSSWNQIEPDFHFAPQVTQTQREKIKKANAADRADVQNVFSREDLLAGVSIIRLILDQGNPAARVWFVRNGNYLFGYALEKYKDLRFGQDAAATSAISGAPSVAGR